MHILGKLKSAIISSTACHRRSPRCRALPMLVLLARLVPSNKMLCTGMSTHSTRSGKKFGLDARDVVPDDTDCQFPDSCFCCYQDVTSWEITCAGCNCHAVCLQCFMLRGEVLGTKPCLRCQKLCPGANAANAAPDANAANAALCRSGMCNGTTHLLYIE
jgi:hypothetical protein